jgi:hypothetical protein
MNEKMKIGLDYWQVCSHWPYFGELAAALCRAGHEVHVISAVGRKSQGTVRPGLDALGITCDGVHEVLFAHPRESPALKLAKCLELGIGVFYDDRQDVCDLLNAHGVMAVQVPRRQGQLSDLQAEARNGMAR